MAHRPFGRFHSGTAHHVAEGEHPKVYVNVRHTVADYERWRQVFDEARRLAAGSTGVKQVLRDVDDPKIITVIFGWDNAENANRFVNDPALREAMERAGTIGMPAARAIERVDIHQFIRRSIPREPGPTDRECACVDIQSERSLP